MSGGPWLANVANNPNINRDPPPPPLNAPPAGGPPPQQAGPQVVVQQHHQQPAIYGPPVGIGIGAPAFAAPFGAGIGAFPQPFFPACGAMDPAMFGMAHGMQGALAAIRAGNFLPGAEGGIGFGLHAGGVGFPPPPPGAMAGVVPPFMAAQPLWNGGGLAFGNVPAMGIGMGMGMMGGNTMHTRPAPMAHDGNMGFAAQPEQQDATQVAGGIPAGVTLMEPAQHSIVMHIRGNVCPWLSPGAQLPVEALAFSSSTGLNRLIAVLGGNAPEECENTAVTECIELGNGLWEKGQTFKFNDAVSRVLTMGDAGWDNTRNRENGQSLHLWCHRI